MFYYGILIYFAWRLWLNFLWKVRENDILVTLWFYILSNFFLGFQGPSEFYSLQFYCFFHRLLAVNLISMYRIDLH